MTLYERLLDAATREFVEKGFGESTTRAIARRAGTSESSLFRHFENKYSILRAVIDTGWKDVWTSVARQIDFSATPLETLHRIGVAMLEFYVQNPDLGALLLFEGWVSGPPRMASDRQVVDAFFADETHAFVRRIDGLLTRAAAEKSLATDVSAQAVREAFFGIVEGLAFGWYLRTHGEYKADYDLRQASDVIGAFIRGISVR